MQYATTQDHPALFMEMRLGKTLVVIRRMLRCTPRGQDGLRVLVVAPTSALGSWERELHAEGQTEIVWLTGTKQERGKRLARAMLYTAAPCVWCLINKEGHLALPGIANAPWDAVVLDESTFIKNPKARVTKFFLQNFRDVPHRWVLTGTPNPESDMELWPQLAFLDGQAFGCKSFWAFRSRWYHQPFYGYDWTPKIGTATMIKNTLARRTLVMRRADVGMDVPKVYERRELPLPRRLQRIYDTACDEMLLMVRGKEISRTRYALVRTTWLRQLVSGFVDKRLEWAGKLDELVELLTGELAQEQVVVWFNYNHEIEAALGRLRKAGVQAELMTGAVKPKARAKLEARFRVGDFRVFLLQQAVAQTGMDLAAADTAIYFSPPLGTMARRQTEDRILNVAKKGPLLILDLVVKDTVDEALLESLQAKVTRGKWTMERVYRIMRRQQDGKTA